MSRTYRWKLALSAVLLGGIAVFSTQGCTITTGDDPRDSGTRFDGATSDYLNTCDGCRFSWCSQQYALCQNDSDCANIYSCALRCNSGDGNCARDCYDRYPAGKTNYRNLAVCDQYYECADTCNSLCDRDPNEAYCKAPAPEVDAGSSTPPPTPRPQSCYDCTDSRCGTEKARCQPSTDCEAYSQCTNQCASSTTTDPLQCVDDCGEVRPGGKTDSERLASCTQSQCRTECGL